MSWWGPTFAQGVNKLDQFLANEGGWSDGNCMRDFQGALQPIGGWSKHAAAAFTGNARASMAWRTLEAVKCLAWGTTSKLYAELAGTRTDITPNLLQTVLTDCFTAVNGSTTFTVYLPFHMLQVGDSFTLSNHQSTVGSKTLEGTFTVLAVPTPGTFTFTFGSASTSDVTTPSGGNVDILIPLPLHFTDWTMATWGENGLFNPSGYGLFEYQPETTYSELIFNGSFTSSSSGWALGTGWAYTGTGNARITATAGTASNLSQSVDGVLEPGRTYQLIFTVVRTAGSVKVQMNVGTNTSAVPYGVTFDSGWKNVNCVGLANQVSRGQAVQFQTTGTLPSPLATSTTYYITDAGNSDGTGMEVATTAGGSSITYASAGSGSHTMTITPPAAAVIDIGTVSAPITKSGTYTRLFVCPADPLDLIFAKDSSFAGSIDTVSLKLMDTAYRITTAPPRIDAMFTDLKGIVIALGTTNLDDGQYSATLYRCSDLGNNKAWVPDEASMATEQILRGIGGRLMAGLNTAEQNIVGGDEGALSLQYQGIAGDAFKPVFLGAGCGFISRHCMAAVNGIVLWMSNVGKFFIFQGAGVGSLGKPMPIGCTLESDVFDHLDEAEWPVIHCGLNLAFQEAWFFYPDNRDSGSECSRAVAVAWTETDKNGAVPWTPHTIARQSWVQPGAFENPIAFGASGGSNYVYDHETGATADGSAMAWYRRSSSFDVQEGEFMTTIDKLIPQFSQQSGNVTIDIFWRLDPRDAFTQTTLDTVTPTTSYLYPEIKAREFQIQFSEGSTGAFMRYAPGNLRMNITPTQARQ